MDKILLEAAGLGLGEEALGALILANPELYPAAAAFGVAYAIYSIYNMTPDQVESEYYRAQLGAMDVDDEDPPFPPFPPGGPPTDPPETPPRRRRPIPTQRRYGRQLPFSGSVYTRKALYKRSKK